MAADFAATVYVSALWVKTKWNLAVRVQSSDAGAVDTRAGGQRAPARAANAATNRVVKRPDREEIDPAGCVLVRYDGRAHAFSSAGIAAGPRTRFENEDGGRRRPRGPQSDVTDSTRKRPEPRPGKQRRPARSPCRFAFFKPKGRRARRAPASACESRPADPASAASTNAVAVVPAGRSTATASMWSALPRLVTAAARTGTHGRARAAGMSQQ